MGVKLDILGNDSATSSEDISHQVNYPKMGSGWVQDGFNWDGLGSNSATTSEDISKQVNNPMMGSDRFK